MTIYDQRHSDSEGNLWLDEGKCVTHVTSYQKYAKGWMFEAPDSVAMLFNETDRTKAVRLYLQSALPVQVQIEVIGDATPALLGRLAS